MKLTSSQTQNLKEYFRQSFSFYYFIVDINADLLYVNPFFKQQFPAAHKEYTGTNASHFFLETDRERFRQAVRDCLASGTGCRIELAIPLPAAPGQMITSWEFSEYKNEAGGPEQLQAIGYCKEQRLNVIPVQDKEQSERYKAYEQSAEGIWMIETTEPVSIEISPEEMFALWKTNAYLAECNDNTARMYGFQKADELIGVPIHKLVDLDDSFWLDNMKSFYRNGFKLTGIETKETDRYGNSIYLLNNMEGVVEEGYLRRIWGTQQDITEKRKAAEQAEKSEMFYRSLFANALDGVLLTDEKGRITFASPSITPILGYNNYEVKGTNTFDYVHPEDRELAATAFLDELGETPKIKFISVRLLIKSGEWKWCMIRGHNLLQDEFVKGIIVYVYDDTIRKETENALLESEQRFRQQATVLNNVTDVIVTTDMNRVVSSWNKIIEKLTGISEKEAVGTPFRDILPTDYSPFTNEQVAAIVFKEGIWRGEISFLNWRGEKIHLLHTISILYDDNAQPIGLLGIGKDITERRKAEERLQKSEQFHRNLSFHSFDGIVMTDPNGIVTYCGPSVKKIAGYAPQNLLGLSLFEFIHPDDLAAATIAFTNELNRKSEINYLYLRLRHATGEWKWCTVRAHNLLHTPGFKAIVIYFTDDTKRKEAEDKLRKSEQNFRDLIYNLKQGVILQDREGRMTICNQAVLDMLGLTEEQLLDQAVNPSWDVIQEDGSVFAGTIHPVTAMLQTRQPVKDLIMGVHRPGANDRVWLLVNASPVFDTDGEIIHEIYSFTDITEQKILAAKLLEQEVQKQRLLTQATIDGQEKERLEIGKELHDNINQHLTTTRLYLEVAKEKASGEVLEMINNSHKTLAAIITEIRSLSQSLVPPTLGDLGLIESIQELCDSLKRAHKFNIEFFSRHFSEDQLPDNIKLMLFRIAQEQVNNIVRHAHASSIQIKLQSDAENIILTIADNGIGFDRADVKKGLGFSNIANRAALFNGSVEIQSALGEGCTVTVTIPLVMPAGIVN